MPSKSGTFELFRYQLLPVDRFLQANLITGVSSIEELISRKNEFFYEALDGAKNFSSGRYQSITKKLYQDPDFFLFRVAVNRSIHVETKDFTDDVVENWPSLLVAVWNAPDIQMFAVQKRTTVFPRCESAVKMILGAIEGQLAHHHLRAIHEPLFEKEKFWSLISKFEGRIKSVDFELITPNMANISGSLPNDLKEFAKHVNSTRNHLKIESDPQAPLHLEEDNDTLSGLVEYSSQGGGNISLKIDGIKKKFNTATTVKEVHLSDVELEGSAEGIATVIKEILNDHSNS